MGVEGRGPPPFLGKREELACGTKSSCPGNNNNKLEQQCTGGETAKVSLFLPDIEGPKSPQKKHPVPKPKLYTNGFYMANSIPGKKTSFCLVQVPSSIPAAPFLSVFVVCVWVSVFLSPSDAISPPLSLRMRRRESHKFEFLACHLRRLPLSPR